MTNESRDTNGAGNTTISAGIVVNSQYNPPPADRDGRTWVRVTALIQAPPEDLYELWRDVEKAPLWQEQLISVKATSAKTSRWVMKSGDTRLEWDSEILNDEPCSRIAWRSTGGDLEQAGEVIFEPSAGNRGTSVTVLQEFKLGKLASAVASLKGRNPRHTVIENLRHFKALAETGEIPHSHTPSHGPRGVIAGWKESLYGEKVETPEGTRVSAKGARS